MKLNTNNFKLNAFKNKTIYFTEFYQYLPFIKKSSINNILNDVTSMKIKNKKKTKYVLKNFKTKLNFKKLILKFFSNLFKGKSFLKKKNYNYLS